MIIDGRIVAAFTDAIRETRDEFVQSALEKPREEITAYQLGLIAGTIQGFKRALDVIQAIISEEKARDAQS